MLQWVWDQNSEISRRVERRRGCDFLIDRVYVADFHRADYRCKAIRVVKPDSMCDCGNHAGQMSVPCTCRALDRDIRRWRVLQGLSVPCPTPVSSGRDDKGQLIVNEKQSFH